MEQRKQTRTSQRQQNKMEALKSAAAETTLKSLNSYLDSLVLEEGNVSHSTWSMVFKRQVRFSA